MPGALLPTMPATDCVYVDHKYDTHAIYDAKKDEITIPVTGKYLIGGKERRLKAGDKVKIRFRQFLIAEWCPWYDRAKKRSTK